LRQLPSCVAVYRRDTDRGVFYVALPKGSVASNRGVFYVADPISSISDLSQQEGVRVPQSRDYGRTSIVVHTPTGSGKTYIFELLYPNLKTQAVFTAPTCASGNTAQSSQSTDLRSGHPPQADHYRGTCAAH